MTLAIGGRRYGPKMVAANVNNFICLVHYLKDMYMYVYIYIYVLYNFEILKMFYHLNRVFLLVFPSSL
jgi:hypothetical protein